VGKDAAGIHTLTVDVLRNNQRLPYKVVTRTERLPLGMPLGSVLAGNILEIRFSTIDESGRIPAITPVEILNKTHEGGDIFHFETGKLYDSAARTKTFNPWEDYLKDMEELNKGGSVR
jgi:hypothetical protein